jgi:hypothetical protein
MRQTTQRSPLDSEPLDLSAVPSGHCYVLDASAVLADPSIDEYVESYELDQPAVFILTTVCLREIDDQKRGFRKSHAAFMEKIRIWSRTAKLSTGPLIGDERRLFFLRAKIEDATDSLFDWLHKDYGDRQLLCLARQLQQAGRTVTILSRDGLMKVLCKEVDLGYEFIGDVPAGASAGEASVTQGEEVSIERKETPESVTYKTVESGDGAARGASSAEEPTSAQEGK